MKPMCSAKLTFSSQLFTSHFAWWFTPRFHHWYLMLLHVPVQYSFLSFLFYTIICSLLMNKFKWKKWYSSRAETCPQYRKYFQSRAQSRLPIEVCWHIFCPSVNVKESFVTSTPLVTCIKWFPYYRTSRSEIRESKEHSWNPNRVQY